MSNADLQDFKEFMRQREEAATAYIQGDAAPLNHLSAHTGDATFYAPRGGSVAGAEDVLSVYERDAKSFAPSGTNAFEILQMAASDGLAYWVGFQRADVYMHGHAGTIPFNLRVTEIFRREADGWKLIHRHADPLVAEQTR